MASSTNLNDLCRFARTVDKPNRTDRYINTVYQRWVNQGDVILHPAGRVPPTIKDYVNAIVSAYRHSDYTHNAFCQREEDYHPIDIAVERMFIRRLEKEKAQSHNISKT
jgi:hypothetical protein